MFLIKSIISFFENYTLFSLTIILIVLTLVKFSNYFRVCYYTTKLPGPRAYPIVGNILRIIGRSHEEITRIVFNIVSEHDRLFRVWLGPVPLIILVNPDDIQELLTSHHGLEKPWIMTNIAVPLVGDSILVARVPKWKRNRGMIVRGFTPNILKTYFKIFVETSLILTEKLEQKLNGEASFDIFEFIAKTSMDSISRSTMGVNINAFDGDASYYNAILSSFYIGFDRIFHLWKIPDFIFKLTPDSRKFENDKAVICGLANKIISERKNKTSLRINNNDENIKEFGTNVLQTPLLDYLMDITQNDPLFTDRQLRDEILLMIVAGYETSANALSYCILNLAAHKDIQTKVCDEIFAVLGDSNRPIEPDDLPQLKYMDMVIKESMRLNSTIPVITRVLTKDMNLDKYLIPKGSVCAIPIFSLHRNPNIWKDPLKFDPERFSLENIKNQHPYAYIPFSGGPRNCIGIRYAWMFMKTVLSTLLRKYEFHTDLNMDELKFAFELSLKLVGGHQVRITKREK